MSRPFIILLMLVTPLFAHASERDAVANVIDTLHQAATEADFNTYFSTFADNSVFIGTDATEIWTMSEFKAYAKPYFDKGQGWTYTPQNRHIYFSARGDVAWFDEMLDNASYGEVRGTGVLEKVNNTWLISQYHLAVPVPNAILNDVVKQIQRAQSQ